MQGRPRGSSGKCASRNFPPEPRGRRAVVTRWERGNASQAAARRCAYGGERQAISPQARSAFVLFSFPTGFLVDDHWGNGSGCTPAARWPSAGGVAQRRRGLAGGCVAIACSHVGHPLTYHGARGPQEQGGRAPARARRARGRVGSRLPAHRRGAQGGARALPRAHCPAPRRRLTPGRRPGGARGRACHAGPPPRRLRHPARRRPLVLRARAGPRPNGALAHTPGARLPSRRAPGHLRHRARPRGGGAPEGGARHEPGPRPRPPQCARARPRNRAGAICARARLRELCVTRRDAPLDAPRAQAGAGRIQPARPFHERSDRGRARQVEARARREDARRPDRNDERERALLRRVLRLHRRRPRDASGRRARDAPPGRDARGQLQALRPPQGPLRRPRPHGRRRRAGEGRSRPRPAAPHARRGGPQEGAPRVAARRARAHRRRAMGRSRARGASARSGASRRPRRRGSPRRRSDRRRSRSRSPRPRTPASAGTRRRRRR